VRKIGRGRGREYDRGRKEERKRKESLGRGENATEGGRKKEEKGEIYGGRKRM
jgi:hypothetical protein